jgi:alpha-L-rhamnosidase
MTTALRPAALHVDDLADPVGTSGRPYFGWSLESGDPNQIQTRYQVLVASSPASLDHGRGDAWDSGVVPGRAQNHVAYGGLALTSNTKYFWKVRVWDGHGEASSYSEPGTFAVGLLSNGDWAGAKWIRRESSDDDDYTFYRKTVVVSEKQIRRATLYISAAHKYELYVNGEWIGAGPSYHYPEHQYYNAYDVTPHLAARVHNVFAVLTHWFGAGQGRPEGARGLIVKIVVEQADGVSTAIGSDASWKQRQADCWVTGQPPRNDEGVGYVDKFDAARWQPDWYLPVYDDSAWAPATEIGPHPTRPWTGSLAPDLSRITEQVAGPAAITRRGGGGYIVDLGEVRAGRPRIRFAGGNAGTVVNMLGGYTLNLDGAIDPRFNQNTNMAYDAVLSGGEFTFLPVEYLGMRYFQLENSPMPVTGDNFAFLERHTRLDETRSTFTSSNATLNEVWAMMKRSLKLGAQEQYLDTPTREKGGFLVDSLNESLAAMSVFGERVLTRKTLNEFLQSMQQYWSGFGDRGRMNAVYPNGDGARDIPDFTQAYLAWAWEYYLRTGDREYLNDNYLKLKSIADYVNRHCSRATGLIHQLTGGGTSAYQHGIVDWPPSMRYGYDMATDARTVINALAYLDYDIVSKIAAELGNAADRDRYRARAEALKTAINARLLNDDGVYVDGLNAGVQSAHVSQQANMLPLALGIVPADRRASVLRRVKEYGMRCGMVTVWWLIRALGESDEGEHLLRLFTDSTWDGWARTLARGGTSTWESWDADSGGGLSQSHPWGAVGVCGIQEYVLGVKPLTPQYETVQIRPLAFGAALSDAGGKLPTDRGDIIVAWNQFKGRFFMTVTLPANVQARVCVPNAGAPGAVVVVDGEHVTGTVEENVIVVENVGSGTHTFARADVP